MAQIRATVLVLALDLGGPVALRRVIRQVNDPETVQLVKSMIGMVALDLELESKGGHSATWVPPIHTTAIGGAATSAIGLAAGGQWARRHRVTNGLLTCPTWHPAMD